MKSIKLCFFCGHEENEHSIGFISKVPACSLCRDISMKDPYHPFKLNNLDYLEERYDEQKK